jgi:anti-sigma regulatory factor (Ser/Thr protein kinase)
MTTSPPNEEPAMLSAPDLTSSAHRSEWHLPSLESSIPALRCELGPLLSTSRLSEDECYDLLLAICEAASNAVEHAQDPPEPFFDVVAEIGRATVVVTVRDHGQWLPPTVSAFRGRGLQMMRLLADTTVTTSADGTTVTIRNLGTVAAAPERTEQAS